MPPVSDACACGMLRASASISATVCSAAATMFDCGALATMMPRLVAASTSTLSTPTPARPITFRLSARSIRSAVSFVAERIRIAVVGADPLGELARRSSRARGRRRSARAACRTPESAIFSATRTRYGASSSARSRRARERRRPRAKTRCAAPTPAPCSTSWPSCVQHHLQARQRGEDVEGAEVAAVGDPQDRPLRWSWPPLAVMPSLRSAPGTLPPSMSLRQLDRGHDGRALVRVAEELEAERGDAGAGGAGEQRVAGR